MSHIVRQTPRAGLATIRSTLSHDGIGKADAMVKSEFLQIRLSPEDRARIKKVAEAEHLEISTWARRELLKAVERWEQQHEQGTE